MSDLTLIDVASWSSDEDHGIFPIGSKPKRMLISPAGVDSPLLPEHPYLFKITAGRFEQQCWSETIAYHLGKVLQLPVPRAFIAIDSRTGQCGVLVEFFYRPEADRFIHGTDFMTRILTDKKRGRPHTIRTNLRICEAFIERTQAIRWWGDAIFFDAIIGNTDRHPDNWGLVFRSGTASMAPLYDNGTSLGYEVAESKARSWSGDDIARYINRGRHHCGWDADEPERHVNLCLSYAKRFVSSGFFPSSVIRFAASDVESLLERCITIDAPIRFSAERARFVRALIEARRSAIMQVLG